MEEKEETLRQKLRYDMRLRVSRTDHAFGPGVAELMEHVEATGSLSKGCKCMQMAYSKGWKILKRAEEDLGILLHASEDFYSHTNWVDQPDSTQPIGVENPPGLNRRY